MISVGRVDGFHVSEGGGAVPIGCRIKGANRGANTQLGFHSSSRRVAGLSRKLSLTEGREGEADLVKSDLLHRSEKRGETSRRLPSTRKGAKIGEARMRTLDTYLLQRSCSNAYAWISKCEAHIYTWFKITQADKKLFKMLDSNVEGMLGLLTISSLRVDLIVWFLVWFALGGRGWLQETVAMRLSSEVTVGSILGNTSSIFGHGWKNGYCLVHLGWLVLDLVCLSLIDLDFVDLCSIYLGLATWALSCIIWLRHPYHALTYYDA